MNVIERVTLSEQIAEVKRELGKRKTVYERLIKQGKMDAEQAGNQMLRMAAVLRTLEKVRDEGSTN